MVWTFLLYASCFKKAPVSKYVHLLMTSADPACRFLAEGKQASKTQETKRVFPKGVAVVVDLADCPYTLPQMTCHQT